MGKHRRSSNTFAKRTAVASVVTLSSSAALAPAASADEVRIPHTTMSFTAPALPALPTMNVPQLPQMPELPAGAMNELAKVPGIAEWIPAAAHQAAAAHYDAVAEVPVKQLPSEGQRIVDVAATKIGAPYQWGASGPNTFDCSGLTSWAYRQVGKHIPRTSYAQAAQGTPVSYKDLQAGDIVAFYSGATHVGIYTGHGTVINAIDYGTPLGETPMDHMPFHSAVRY